MPKKLEAKLKAEYPGNDAAVYGTMNNLGYMKGSKVTAKGKALDRKGAHPSQNLGKYLHPRRKSR